VKLRHRRINRRSGKYFRNGGWTGGWYVSRAYSSFHDRKPTLPIAGSQV